MYSSIVDIRARWERFGMAKPGPQEDACGRRFRQLECTWMGLPRWVYLDSESASQVQSKHPRRACSAAGSAHQSH